MCFTSPGVLEGGSGEYFEEEPAPTGVDGVKAISVSSNVSDNLDELRILAPSYVPSVLNEAIVYVADGVTGGTNTRGVNPFPRSRYVSWRLVIPHCTL